MFVLGEQLMRKGALFSHEHVSFEQKWRICKPEKPVAAETPDRKPPWAVTASKPAGQSPILRGSNHRPYITTQNMSTHNLNITRSEKPIDNLFFRKQSV